MISTDEATSIMEDSGIEVIKLPNLSDPSRDLVYIGTKIVWEKMFIGMEAIDPLKERLVSVPHYDLIKRIIIKYRPYMDKVEVEGESVYAFVFPEIRERGDRLKHLDQYLGYIFHLVGIYITPLIEPFEYNDRISRGN